MAVDWLGRNLYWIDGERSQIVAISLSTSSNYSIILDEDLDQPRSLALMPQKGWTTTIQLQVFTTFNTLSLSPTLSLLSCHPRLLFWTEIGNVVKIERAGMDGSDRQVVVNSSLGWPGAVTVDTVSNRIYWTDERLKAIGSATLDGNELQVRVGPRPTLGLEASGGLTWSCALRSCRSKRRPTPSHWLYSTKTCSGRTPRDEWCSLLTRPLGRTPRFF